MRIVSTCIIVAAVFLSCQEPNDAEDNTTAVLQKTDFKVRTDGNPNFCYHIWDSTTVVYRNSDTIIIIPCRGIVGCPTWTLNYQLQNDTLELIYRFIDMCMIDTMKYYLEYGFKVVSEGNLWVIAQDSAGTFVSLDTTINTKGISKEYDCE